MTRTPSSALSLVSALALSSACGSPEDDLAAVGAAAHAISAPAGTGRYCSMTWASGGWAFAWYNDLTNDPCNYIRSHSGAGGTVRRAGLFSTSGGNNVAVRCNSAQSWVVLGVGAGDGPLSWAFGQVQGQRHCTFTVSPRELPVFERVFPSGTNTTQVTGIDFARGPYHTLDLRNQFGQPGASTAATVVDWRARDKSGQGYINDHDGHDILMPTGTSLLAPADSLVLAARFRDVSHVCPGEAPQGEVFLRHIVTGGASSEYSETFITYFAHLSQINVSAGQQVAKGAIIGRSGGTGCSSAPHLHLGTFRQSNTASARLYPFVINSNFAAGMDQNSANGYQIMIDPHGFYPPAGFDPWAWRAYPWGALSVNLWKPGHAPPTGSW